MQAIAEAKIVPNSIPDTVASAVEPTHGPIVVLPDSPERVDLGGLGITWKIDGAASDGRFSIVHHPMAPRALAAPIHRHHREDEYSYVISGTLGALLGDDVVTAGPGTWVHKPRMQWHTFWNAGDTPLELVEVISPAGFEDFFRQLPSVWGGDLDRFMELAARYELDMQWDSVPGLCERFGLRFGEA